MKTKLYILLVPFILTVSSCDDFLNEQPVSELSSEKFWKTEDDFKAAIAGMYDGLQDVVASRYIDWGEGRSDNFTNGGTGINEINFALNGLTSNMSHVNWDDLYATISRANLIIKYLPISTATITETSKNHYLAQAYAMRGYSHFLAVKIWGDVPLLLEPVVDRTFKPSRAPLADVLNQAAADLNQALSLADPTKTNVFEINNGVILAILTDLYMWQLDYQKVIQTTDEIAKLKRYILANTPAEWNGIFSSPETSKEAIWSIFWAFEQDGSNGIAGKIGSSTNTSPYEIDDNLLLKWEQHKKDFRRYLTYDTLQSTSGVRPTDIYKHYPIVAGKQTLPPTNQAVVRNSLYRLSDILLMRAEALNKLERKPEAIDILNQIKKRAGVDLVDETMFSTDYDLETAILDERQFELFAEGKRWFDLRRTGRVIEVMDPLLKQRQAARGIAVVGFGDPGLILFPISRDALNENTNLVQNPPYSR